MLLGETSKSDLDTLCCRKLTDVQVSALRHKFKEQNCLNKELSTISIVSWADMVSRAIGTGDDDATADADQGDPEKPGWHDVCTMPTMRNATIREIVEDTVRRVDGMSLIRVDDLYAWVTKVLEGRGSSNIAVRSFHRQDSTPAAWLIQLQEIVQQNTPPVRTSMRRTLEHFLEWFRRTWTPLDIKNLIDLYFLQGNSTEGYIPPMEGPPKLESSIPHKDLLRNIAARINQTSNNEEVLGLSQAFKNIAECGGLIA